MDDRPPYWSEENQEPLFQAWVSTFPYAEIFTGILLREYWRVCNWLETSRTPEYFRWNFLEVIFMAQFDISSPPPRLYYYDLRTGDIRVWLNPAVKYTDAIFPAYDSFFKFVEATHRGLQALGDPYVLGYTIMDASNTAFFEYRKEFAVLYEGAKKLWDFYKTCIFLFQEKAFADLLIYCWEPRYYNHFLKWTFYGSPDYPNGTQTFFNFQAKYIPKRFYLESFFYLDTEFRIDDFIQLHRIYSAYIEQGRAAFQEVFNFKKDLDLLFLETSANLDSRLKDAEYESQQMIFNAINRAEDFKRDSLNQLEIYRLTLLGTLI